MTMVVRNSHDRRREDLWPAKINDVLGEETRDRGGEDGGEIEGIVGKFSPELGRDRGRRILLATVDSRWGRRPALAPLAGGVLTVL
jgi:hypothetical protein